ncbi:MAG: TIGR00269 family protein [archaeon]|jgi:uncharacterized protein (TIGR00269 family)
MVIKNPEKCEICGKKRVITLGYGPHYFCDKHFVNFFETRIKKTIRKYNLISPKEKLLVALSGGKDSIVTLKMLHKFYSKRNEIKAIIIDEGVDGYRDKAIKLAIKTCKELNVNYKLISFEKEFGITNDKLMPLLIKNQKLGGTCAFCGTLRRHIMNKYAKKMKMDKLVTGHNLDDETQSFVMNVFNNDFDRLLRMGATAGVIEHEGFIKRIKPLYETPEKEIIAYCAYKEIPHYSQDCCPYSYTAKRNEFREMLNNFETRFPGTEFSILRFYENLKKELMPSKEMKIEMESKLKKCKNCKEPTQKEFCKTCEMIEKLKTEANKNEKENQINLKNKKPKSKKVNLKENEIKNNSKYNKKLTCSTTKYKK